MDFSADIGTQDAARRELQGVTRELEAQARLLERSIGMQSRVGNQARGRGRGSDLSGLELAPSIRPLDLTLQPSQISPTQRENFGRLFGEELHKRTSTLQSLQSRGVADLSRRDVRDVRGLFELMRGNVNLHTVRETAQLFGETKGGAALGFGKIASTLSALAGPLMIGQEVVSTVTNAIHEKILNEQEAAHARGANIDFAREHGVSGNVRQSFERRIEANNNRKRLNAIHIAQQKMLNASVFEWQGWVDTVEGGNTLFVDDWKRLTGAYAKEDQAEEAKTLATLIELRSFPDIARRLATTDEIHRRAGPNASTVELNETRDLLLSENTQAADNLMYKQKHANEYQRAAELQHEVRKTWDPVYNAIWRNTEQLQRVAEEKISMDRQDWQQY